MAFVWTILTFLFFFSLFMVSVSVFTPRTALFFREKTKTRGAILWLSTALVCAVLVNEFGPSFVPGAQSNSTEAAAGKDRPAALPGYSFQVLEDIQGEKLSIACVLNAPVDADQLRILALKVYSSRQGHAYKEVLIQWRLAGQGKDSAPWALSNCLNGNWEINVSSPQG